MKHVFPNRVTHISETSPEIFCFQIVDEFSPTWTEVRSILTTSDDEQTIVSEAIKQSIAHPNHKIHIQGISLSESIEEIRKFFEIFGCFDPLKNRYLPDFQTIPLTFGANISDTWVFWSAPRRGSGNAKAVRAALNNGLLSHLHIDSIPKRGTKKPIAGEDALSRLLSDGSISPFTLGRLLGYNALERGLANESRDFTITIHSHS